MNRSPLTEQRRGSQCPYRGNGVDNVCACSVGQPDARQRLFSVAPKCHLGPTESHIRKRWPQRTSLGGKLASPGRMKQWGLGTEAFHVRFLMQSKEERGGEVDLRLTLSSAGTLCRPLKQWKGVGTGVPRPGLIYHCRHLSWKHLVQRCKSFNHTDSVMTKSRAPLGARNSPTRCGNTLHSLHLGSSRPRLQNKGRLGTSITNFVHIKD